MSKTKSRTRARPATLRTPAPSRREVDVAHQFISRAAGEHARVAAMPLANLGGDRAQTPPESELDREYARLETCAANFVADVLQLAERLQPAVRTVPAAGTEVSTGTSTATSQLGGRLSDVSERLIAGRNVVGKLLDTLAL